MKRIIAFGALLFTINCSAQDSTTTSGIITKKTFGVFKMDGKRISENTLRTELYKVPATIPLYKKAKTSKII